MDNLLDSIIDDNTEAESPILDAYQEEDTPPLHPVPKNIHSFAALYSLRDGALNGTDQETSTWRAKSIAEIEGIDALRAQISEEERQVELTAMRGAYNQLRGVDTPAAEALIAEAQKRQDWLYEGAIQPDAFEQSTVDILAGYPIDEHGRSVAQNAASDLYSTNLIHETLANAQEGTTFGEIAAWIGGSLVGSSTASLSWTAMRTYETASGEDLPFYTFLTDPKKIYKGLSEMVYSAQTPEAKRAIMQLIVDAADKHSGYVGKNEAVKAQLFAHIADPLNETSEGLSQLDAVLQTFFLPMGAATAYRVLGAMGKKAATPLIKTVAKVNPEVAGKMAKQVMEGNAEVAQAAGINKADSIKIALRSGMSPTVSGDFGEAGIKLMDELEAENRAFFESVKGVKPSSMSEMQRVQFAEKLATVLPKFDKSIVNVSVKEAGDSEMTFSIVRKNQYTGATHTSEEAAHAYAAEHGISVDKYKVVPAEEINGTAPKASIGGRAAPISYKAAKVNSAIQGEKGVQLFTKPTTLADGVIVPKNMEVSSSFPSSFASGAAKIVDMLGMKTNLLFVHEDDLAGVAALGKKWGESVETLVKEDKAFPTALGWHKPLGGDTAMILIKRNAFAGSKVTGAFTMAHEIGHAFVREYLHKGVGTLTSKAWKDMEAEFHAWRTRKSTTLGQYAVTHHTLEKIKEHVMKAYIKEFGETMTPESLLKYAGGRPEYVKWFEDFEEFFVEQLSKHMLEKAPVRSAFFTPIAKALKAIYAEVAKFLDKAMVDSSWPTVTKFLDDHIKEMKRLNKGGSDEVPDYFSEGVFTDEEIAMMMRESDSTGGIYASLTPRQKKNKATEMMMKSRKERARAMAEGAAAEGEASAVSSKGFYIVEETTEPYMYKDIAAHTEEEMANKARLSWIDPKQKITDSTYMGNLVAQFATAKEKVALQEWFKSALKGVSTKEQRAVFDLMEELDAMSNAGTATTQLNINEAYLLSRGFNDKQVKMYVRVRDMRDYLHARHDGYMVNELKSKGYHMRLVLDTKGKLGVIDSPVHVYTDSMAIKSLIGRGEVKKMYDASNGKMVAVSGSTIDEMMAEGRQFVKLHSPIDGVQHVITGGDHKMMPLSTVLPYRPHEFSRIYSEQYFITMGTKPIVDGVEQAAKTIPIRTARSSREAKEYVGALNKAGAVARDVAAGIKSVEVGAKELDALFSKWKRSGAEVLESFQKGELDMSAEFNFRFDREKEKIIENLVDEHVYSGRMFESQRGKKLMSVDSDRVNTMSAVESLGVELAMVSKQANLSEWRRASVARYLNTFVDKAHRTGDDMSDFLNAPINKALGTPEYSVAKEEREYIKSVIMGRSQEEKESAAYARKLLERIEQKEGVLGATAEKIFTGMQLRKADPIQFLRTVNFHLSLGMFNPSQLLVQAIGMMNAAYIHPIHGMQSAMKAPLLRMALMSDNPEVWRKLASTGKVVDVADFEKTVKAVRKSGILDSVKNTALYNNTDGFDNIFKEYGTGAFGKASTFFFDRGEEFSRLVSWDIAKKEWQTANKGVDWTTDKAIAEITKRMDDFTLGMTQANVANYQRGLLSIPFQFLQYNVKLATELGRAAIGKSGVFTQKQAAQIMVGNLIMWGTAGNGLRGFGDEWFAEKAGLGEDGKLAITQGAVASLLNYMSDGEAKLAIGNRFGTFNWYRDTIQNMASGELDIPEFMFGVTKSNLTKGWDVLADVQSIWYGADVMGPEEALEGLRILSTMPSGLSNAQKAWVLQHNGGRLYSKKGDLLTEVTQQEAFAQVFGIQAAELPDYYRQMDLMRADSKDMGAIASRIKHLQMMQLRALGDGNYSLYNSYKYAMTLLLTEDPMKATKLLKKTRESWADTTLSDETLLKLESRGLSDVTTTK